MEFDEHVDELWPLGFDYLAMQGFHAQKTCSAKQDTRLSALCKGVGEHVDELWPLGLR